MAVYTHVSFEQIAEVVSHYGLGTLVMAKGIAEGVENSNYLLEVAGNQNQPQKYILTLYEKRVSEKDLPFFMDLMEVTRLAT
jgi:homoserine kinase type II